MLIHNPHRNGARQVRIDENHVAKIEAGCLHDGLYAVKRQIDLRCRIIGNFAAHRITAGHTRNEKPVVSEDARRSGILGVVVRGMDSSLVC